jgi:hypothetical protein
MTCDHRWWATTFDRDCHWVETELETFVGALWDRYTSGEIRTWPGEDTRLALFHRHLREREETTAMLVSVGALRARRRRLQDRLDDVRTGISARQSLLNGLKAELEATGPR